MRGAGNTSVDYSRPEPKVEENNNSDDGVFEAGLIDAINQIFSEFAFAYHNQYHKAFPDCRNLRQHKLPAQPDHW
jgi:hypothetical protein